MSTRSDKLRARWANPEMRQRLIDGIKRAKANRKDMAPSQHTTCVDGQPSPFPINSLVTWYSEYVPSKIEGEPGTYFNQRFGRVQSFEKGLATIIRQKYLKPVIEVVKIDELTLVS